MNPIIRLLSLSSILAYTPTHTKQTPRRPATASERTAKKRARQLRKSGRAAARR